MALRLPLPQRSVPRWPAVLTTGPFPATTPHAFPGYQKEPTHAHDLNLLARISDLVAQGINIAGIAQILHLQHRNTELESDNSDLKSENARLRSDKPTKAVPP